MPTGFHLVARLMGDVSYISRSEYADRDAMFATHTARVRDSLPADARVPSSHVCCQQACTVPSMYLCERLYHQSSCLTDS